MSFNFLLLDVEELKSSPTVVKDIDEVRVLILDSKCSRLLTNAFVHSNKYDNNNNNNNNNNKVSIYMFQTNITT